MRRRLSEDEGGCVQWSRERNNWKKRCERVMEKLKKRGKGLRCYQ